MILQVFRNWTLTIEVTTSLIEKRDFEAGVCKMLKADELRERAAGLGVKVKKRRKDEYIAALIFQLCQELSFCQNNGVYQQRGIPNIYCIYVSAHIFSLASQETTTCTETYYTISCLYLC